jgi:hypothetical protein
MYGANALLPNMKDWLSSFQIPSMTDHFGAFAFHLRLSSKRLHKTEPPSTQLIQLA